MTAPMAAGQAWCSKPNRCARPSMRAARRVAGRQFSAGAVAAGRAADAAGRGAARAAAGPGADRRDATEGIDERVFALGDRPRGVDRRLCVVRRGAAGIGADRRAGASAARALGDERSSVQESFEDGLLDWPHYTRPEVFGRATRARGAEFGRPRRHRALATQAECPAHLAATTELIGRAPLDAERRRCWRNFDGAARWRATLSEVTTMSNIIQTLEAERIDAHGARIQTRRYGRGADQSGRGRPRARAGLRRGRDCTQQPRFQFLVYGAQGLAW